MTISFDERVRCRQCGHTELREFARTVNAANQEIWQAIIRRTFQRFQCQRCSATYALDGPLTVVDFERRRWIAVYPADWERRFREFEAQTRRVFDDTAPDRAQDASHPPYVVRTVFGLDALAEKALALDAGLDDLSLEAWKLARLSPLTARARLRPRLRRVTGDVLTFWAPVVDRGDTIRRDRVSIRRGALSSGSGLADRVRVHSYVDVGAELLEGST